MEDPNLDEAQYGPMRSEEPIYHTLEGPLSDDPYGTNCNSEYADVPIYNILEEGTHSTQFSVLDKYGAADLQGPVYNILEGPE